MGRTKYQDIRMWAIESAYLTCRSVFSPNLIPNCPVEKISFFGAFFSDYECSETDLEELMWRTLELIFDRGIGPKMAHDECTRIIADILARNDFETLVRDIPEKEAVEIRTDLQLLGFL